MRKVKNSKKIIYKICHSYDDEIKGIIKTILSNYDKRISTKRITGYVVEGSKGRANINGIFTVPHWAYKRGPDYFMYYTAHELSHIIAYKKFNNHGHDKNFYKIFCQLCPETVQHYEIKYKKRSTLYGVKNKT